MHGAIVVTVIIALPVCLSPRAQSRSAKSATEANEAKSIYMTSTSGFPVSFTNDTRFYIMNADTHQVAYPGTSAGRTVVAMASPFSLTVAIAVFAVLKVTFLFNASEAALIR